jgi:hypothetical protein
LGIVNPARWLAQADWASKIGQETNSPAPQAVPVFFTAISDQSMGCIIDAPLFMQSIQVWLNLIGWFHQLA